MKSTILSRRDLDFLLFEWLAADELTKRARFAEHSRETFSDVLDLCEDLATRYFATHNKKSDQNEPTFDGTTVTVIPEVKDAIDAFAAASRDISEGAGRETLDSAQFCTGLSPVKQACGVQSLSMHGESAERICVVEQACCDALGARGGACCVEGGGCGDRHWGAVGLAG